MNDATFDVIPFADHDEWLDIRSRGIGGSDVAAIMGFGVGENARSWIPSPLTLWLEKTGRAEPKDLSGIESVEWGVTLEPVIRDKFAANHPEYTVQMPSGVYVNNENPWERASLDAELFDKESQTFGVLEIKTAGERMADDWKNGVPVYYQTQVTHYLNVTGYQFAWVAVLIGGQAYREFRFWPDDSDRAAVRDAVRTFWGFVQRDEAPALIGHKDEGESLTRLNSADTGEIRQETASIMDALIAEYEDAGAEIKRLEEKRRIAANRIKEHIGTAHGIVTDVYKVTWLRSMRTGYDYKRLDADHPGLRDGYATQKLVDGGIRVSEVGR